MADRFEDPRVEGELRELNAKLSRIERNVQEAESAARQTEARTRRAQPTRAGASEPTLDDDYRQTEAARRRANEEERATRAKERGARAAEAQDRFETRRRGARSAGVYDRETGELVRGFRGAGARAGLGDDPANQADAVRRARAFADNLNRAQRAAEGVGNQLIRHPQLFGRQVYAPTGPYFSGRTFDDRQAGQRPPGGAGAAEARLSRAELDYERARRDYTNTLRRKNATEGDVTGARLAREAARQEVAAAQANVTAARAEAAARQAHAAQLRALAAEEAAASRQMVLAQRAAAAGIVRYAAGGAGAGGRALPPGAPPPGASVPFGSPPPGLPAGAQQRQLGSGDRAWDEAAKRARARGPLGDILDDEGQAAQRTGERYERASSQARGYYDTVAYGSRAGNLAGNELRRRGALTTEFISAAARGQTTIRELGYQVGATTAKFAGWTAAAGFIYTALGAIRELGVGAIDTVEGVNTLQRIIPRIDTGRATQELQNLSREFNLPIQDVADAAYGISKTFGAIADPAEAARRTFIATRSALFLVKIGELDAATATRYLTSIIQGFNLEAAEMPRLTDTINAAQNRFGGNVGQIAQGVAGAAGAFRAAGSDYRELITLISVGQRVTGRTGQEIGTALRRSSEIYRRPERRQKIIDLLGIDPADTSIYQLIQRAQDVAAKKGPDVARAIAKAISTPELASGRILPILQARDLTDVVHNTLSPKGVQGSAANELDRALKGPLEKLRRLRVDLQLFGAELAESGFLAPFGTLVATLDQALRILEKMADIVGDLPGPLRTALAYGLPATAVVGGLRRLDVGGGSGLLGRNAGARTRANILTGIQAEEELVLQERTRSVNEMVSSQRRADRFGRRLADLTGEGADIDNQRVILENQRQAALRTASEAEDELNDLTRRSGQLEGQKRVVRRSRFRSEAEVIRRAQQAGVPYAQPGLERPLAEQPVPLGGPGGPIPGAGEAEARQQAAQTSRLRQRAERFNASVSEMGRSGRLLGATAQKGAAAASGAAGALGGAGRALGSMGAGLLAAFGPLDLIILGLIAFAALAELLSQKEGEVDSAVQGLRRAQGPEGLAQQIRASREQADATSTKVAGAFKEFENVAVGLGRFAAGDTRGGSEQIFGGTTTPGERLNAEADRQKARLQKLRGQQDRGERLYQSQVRERLQARFAAATTDEEREKAIDDARREYADSLYRHSGRLQRRPSARAEAAQTRDLIARLRGSVAATAQGVDAMAEAIAQIEDATSAERFVQEMQSRFRQRGVGRELPRGAAGLQRIRSLVFTETDAEKRAALLQQLQQLQDDILGRLEQRFQRALAVGADAGRARTTYINSARLALFGVRTQQQLRELEARRRQLAAAIRLTQRIISRASAQLDDIAGRYLPGDPHAAEAAPGARRQRAQNRLQQLLQRLNAIGPPAAREDLNAFGDLQRDSQEAVDNILEERRRSEEERLQEAISLFQARQRLSSAQGLIGASQGARLQRAVSDAQAFLGFLQGQRGVDQVQLIEAQTAIAEAQDALAQYIREQAQALVRAKAELARSRTYDPIKLAEIALKEAQELLKFAETPAEKIQGLAEVNNRRRELQNTRLQERVDQQQFLFDLGRLTREQYASWIQRFLRAHGELRRVNRDMFRQLRRTLHQLRTETEEDLDLQVGNIRLPTLYDVRRIIQQGTRTAPSGVLQQSNNFQINGATDPEAVASAVGSTLRSTSKSGMRAAGLTG